jgi:hypothetical protein
VLFGGCIRGDAAATRCRAAADGPCGPWPDDGAAAAERDVDPPESLTEGWGFWGFEVVAGSTVTATCVPPEPVPAVVPAEPAGVDAEADTVVDVGVELTLACVVTGCGETGGADTVVEADAAGGAVWALAVADADAAGVLADTVALAAGAGVTDTLVDAVTVGVAGAPGKPSACAGRAEDRHHAAPTPRPMRTRRNRRFRAITVEPAFRRSLSRRTYPKQRESKPNVSCRLTNGAFDERLPPPENLRSGW